MTTLRAIPVYKVILQWLRKTGATYIGAMHELTVDPDDRTLYLHDEATVGGVPVKVDKDNVLRLATWAKGDTKPSYDYNEVGAAAANHTHDYASSGHNHDGVYAPANHTHDYAATNHNHDLVYAGLNHTHDYAASNHNHSGVYEPAITKGTTEQYFRGDMSLATMPTPYTYWRLYLNGAAAQNIESNEIVDFIAGDGITVDGDIAPYNDFEAIGDQVRISVNFGTSGTTVARGNHTHSYQPVIRTCTDAEAQNGEIYFSSSVYGDFSFKDYQGNIRRI